jgi:hypothetical protein
MSPSIHKRLSFPLLCLVAVATAGCVGTSVPSGDKSASASHYDLSAERSLVLIRPIANQTGDQTMDSLALYLHLKTAQILEDSGRYQVVSDELLREAEALLGGFVVEEPEFVFEVVMLEVAEKMGGTVRIGPVSQQSMSAEVSLQLRRLSLADESLATARGKGGSTRGAWGVFLQVDRESMLRGEGFWQMDRSALGIAASEALEKAFRQLN